MSNLQPPNYEPELSDLRTRTTPTSGYTSTSALSRRNANRNNRRQDRPWEQQQSRYRVRRLAGFGRQRSSLSPPPLASTQHDEPASKRRRTERSGPQAEMEQLPMELRYCDGGRYDGGNYDGHRHYRNEYMPECALRDDSSVYCSKKSKCNMILRHEGAQCFALQKLVVRAPQDGFTSPVRAGMIFVVMDDTDLLSRTNYTIRYESEDEESSDEEGLDYLLEMDRCEEEEEEDDDDEEQEPDRSDTLPRPDVFSPAYGSLGPPLPVTAPTLRPPMHTNAPPQALWRSLDERLSTPVELLKPDAVFSNPDGGTKFVIEFTPPISGRYILAKFFCPRRHENIDIEFIGAYGWAGRRFFPAVTMR